ncbi:ribosome biogenesis GTPase Der [Prevotella nigrescens]|uniref:ribosome biogenesis GTPase Der n=1 Tax=Prevotella nigrescens TaxID=28133 RepID=UPI00360CD1D2
MANLVAIVGRPNVGKSTLFNRLTQSRRAIVSDTAGTTRDRQYGKCQWNGREFSVVDTGGWVVNSDDIFEDAIRKQVLVATEEADLVLFVVDNETGVTDWDEDVAQILRRTKLPVILVANKVDNSGEYYMSADFYRLGLGDPVCISAQTGSGTGDLLDLLLERMKDVPDEGPEDDIPRFAVVGRPNAGKSSLINAFIGEDRNIVTEIAGTTRDSIYTRYNKFGFDFYLVDTAGIRRKNKVTEDLEFYSVMRSIRSIENSDVCILMIDATRGIEAQDMNIYGDSGNVLVLKKRAEKRNISVNILSYNIGDSFPKNVDIVVAGGGQDSGQEKVNKDLLKIKDKLKKLAENYTPMLLICGSYQLFGNYFRTNEGKVLKGIGILNAYTEATNERMVGNIITESVPFGEIIGYENHSGKTTLEGDTLPLGLVKLGAGNNGEDSTEGARYKNVVGTYLHGSLLPKNPKIADFLISEAMAKKYPDDFTKLKTLDDSLADKARKVAVTRPR